jgi:RNA polymerase sigma-70 factor (ECF subfamily)
MEQDLIKQAQAGDQQAFRELVALYGTLTERTARVLLTERAAAEDAVQEAWLDAWRGLKTFQTERPFRPWLLTLVANRCRMSVRRKGLASLSLDHKLAEELPDPEDLATRTIRAASHAELRSLLGQLGEDQQRIIALRFFADLSLEEIAALLDIPLGTVKSRLHRGLSALRTRLCEQPSASQTRPGVQL